MIPFTVRYVQKIFDNPHSRDKHVYMHQQNQHHCPDCDKTFPFMSQLQNHRGQTHEV